MDRRLRILEVIKMKEFLIGCMLFATAINPWFIVLLIMIVLGGF